MFLFHSIVCRVQFTMQHTENIHFIGHTACTNHRAPPANSASFIFYVCPAHRSTLVQIGHPADVENCTDESFIASVQCPRRKPAISVLCVSTSFPGRWQEKAVFHTNLRITFVENLRCATLQQTALSFICRYHTTRNRVGKASRRKLVAVPNKVK